MEKRRYVYCWQFRCWMSREIYDEWRAGKYQLWSVVSGLRTAVIDF